MKTKIRIESSSLVTPFSPTPNHIIATSNIDLVIPRIHTPSVYFFRPCSSSSNTSFDHFFSIPRLLLSLRHALVPFYPMAGRLRPRLAGAHSDSLRQSRSKEGRLDIDCNARGVLFVHATALHGCMDDFGDGKYFTPTVQMRDLIPRVDGSDDEDCPLLILQVTRFRCGGVALGVGVQHHLADGIASLAFINYWAKLNAAAAATPFPPQPLPFFDRSLLMARHPPSPAFDHVEYQPPPPLILPPPSSSSSSRSARRLRRRRPHQKTQYNYSADVFSADYDKASMANHDAEAYRKEEEEEEDFESEFGDQLDEIASDLFVFSGEQLESLKRMASASASASASAELTSYEVLSAHVWKCVCAARGLAEEQESKLYIATDGRRRLRPELPAGYFGNAIFTATPMRKAGEIVSGKLEETAMAIRAALERMKDEYLRSAIDYLEEQPSLAALARGAHTFRSPNLGITSWARLPIYDADFGWGKPLWMGPAGVPFEGLAYLLPPPNVNTPLSLSPAHPRMLLSITLAPSHMHTFRNLLYHF